MARRLIRTVSVDSDRWAEMKKIAEKLGMPLSRYIEIAVLNADPQTVVSKDIESRTGG